ncbi:hypothetical protein AVEN_234620-1 [Araneus ventricosus]|uniref:Uncharacterized protein n=1 Tax=Araneus ventricosus TaxID=182803 RepID=A0A4Y2WIE0_ARAVE|nr:hypothetical protein AVEN_234620-1 [Araneus ventricosus]
MASGPLKQKTIWPPPPESVAEKQRTPSLKHINKIALSPKVHVLEFDTHFQGFTAVVIRPVKQRVVEYPPVGTAFCPLPLNFRSFTDVSPANLRGIETGYLFCENANRILLVSEAPGETEGIASLFADRLRFL